MKIASWNVNSLKVRLPHVIDWLTQSGTDILCLQELKMADEVVPAATFAEQGWHLCFTGQKTYNGVAIISRQPGQDIIKNIPDFADPQQRVIAATYPLGATQSLRVICAYVPNGQSLESDKYQYKLGWLEAFTAYIRAQLVQYPYVAVLGDFNIAPTDEDVHDPAAWAGQVLCSPPERAAFEQLIGLGLVDSFRKFPQAPKAYTWWDYRMMGFRRNLGLRIDHILLSTALAERCTACDIDRAPRKLEKPSDHTPIVATLDL